MTGSNAAAMLLRSLLTLSSVVEARDTYTGGHSWRVAQYAKILGKQLELSEENIQILGIGGYIHDLGKVTVPDAILNKQGSLTDFEYNQIGKHPEVGHDILQHHPLAHLCQDAVLYHHERYDGDGYPTRKKGKEIDLLTRIISVADTFDALTSTRPYRQGLPMERAAEILRTERNQQLDGDLVEAFLDLAIRDRLLHIIGHSDANIPVLDCPVCGPVITIPRNARVGDLVLCKPCKGWFELQQRDGAFVVEFAGNYADVAPVERVADEPQITDLVEECVAHAPGLLQ